jgi:dipeptidyl aminopeptidase/acylaminoacyl peptidase
LTTCDHRNKQNFQLASYIAILIILNFVSFAVSMKFLITLLTLAAAVPAWASAPPASVFFENADFTGAVLSPDGKSLAIKIGIKGQRVGLGVVDLSDMSVKPVVQFSDTDIDDVEWVNNERLAFDTHDHQTAYGMREYAPGLYSIKKDGTMLRQLADRTGGGGVHRLGSKLDVPLLPYHTYLTGEQGSQDSEEIYVRNANFNRSDSTYTVNLIRLNTVTGRSRRVIGPNASVRRFLFDHRGEPRLALASDNGVETVHVRDQASGEWRQLSSQHAYKISEGDYDPEGFGPDGTLYVRAYYGDKLALFKLNLDTGKLADKPVVMLTDFDFRGELVVSNGKLLGIDYLGDAAGTTWMDKRMQEIQAEVDAKLQGTVNQISVGRHHAAPWVLVRAYADTMPDTYLLYHTEAKTFTKIVDSRPLVKSGEMARQAFVKVKARDGLEIPTWVTTPRGTGKNLPMVVLVHGGPYVRGGEWGWEPQRQFLASRGYLVVEPEFRGSDGYGFKLLTSGFKQWGLKMQDDIADAAKWAIAQGMADPKRICIAGASYGGYATLMGLIRDPDLYKCGINWAGVTDIELMYTGTWLDDSDLSAQWKRHGMPDLVGDPVKDAQQLKDTSPLLNATRITQPLLLAYGSSDRRVPLFHGKKFLSAVKEGNKQVEWIEYPGEGHGWGLAENRIDFWTRVERFLDRHIGNKTN